MEQLKKCPFCGGKVGIFETHEHQFVICHGEEDGDMSCPIGANECVGDWIYDTKEEAIAAWNTRKPMERILEQIEEELRYSTEVYKDEEIIYRKGIRFVRRLLNQANI